MPGKGLKCRVTGLDQVARDTDDANVCKQMERKKMVFASKDLQMDTEYQVSPLKVHVLPQDLHVHMYMYLNLNKPQVF